MKIYIVGTGMEGGKTLTAEAKNAIESADILIGAKRMTEPFAAGGKRLSECWKAEEICGLLDSCGCESAAVLMSGDCGFFSGAEKLSAMLKNHDVRIISGISSPAYFCSKLGLTWQDMRFVSLHGTDGNIVRYVRRYGKCFFLLGGSITPRDICGRLSEYETGDVTVHIGSRLAYPDERIISGTVKELSNVRYDPLSVMIIENPAPEKCTRTGIPDREFIRGEVPMTKSEVRSVVASKLKVCYNDTVWDIGCGTGSVSVECALAAYEGTVYAVDKNKDAVGLTGMNARKFGCDNIRVLHGDISVLLGELPVPDTVFIGGASGRISGILDRAFSGGNRPDTVITAVTLETLNEAVEALKNHGLSPEVTQISAVRTHTVGAHTMLDAQNPVFIIGGAAV
ncbi:MAG: precorrin-6y C5,15-methyltransferase (decarboxylating) subunit CbiE [Ruminiclostridium sp.]|nr:precorrin-6y C5,15-methyltransferase (decarboxylating) subunit CbiE [Ruminiclostridium sp.]